MGEVYFYDGEMIEGIISNTRDFVLEDGFFLIPTDPNGNNRLAYVNKGGSRIFTFSECGTCPRTFTSFRVMPSPTSE